jgi:hypothetical protein
MVRGSMGVLAGLLACGIAGCDSDDGGGGAGGGGGGGGGGAILKCAVARVVQGSSDLVPGPIARGTPGDLVIENDKLRAIIQKGGRNWYNISEFGGNIIDALPKAANGSLLGQDNFEEFVLGTNIESAPNYQAVTVLNAGGPNPDGSCKPAVVRATGPDDLLDFVNGSSAIRGLTLEGIPLNFPASADDVDLPVQIQTDYTLDAGQRYITIATTLTNESASALDIYLVEYMNGSGEVEVFQHGYGFGEAFATAPCTFCNYAAYAGHEGGAGVSYGLIHKETGSSSVSVSGVTVFLYGRDIVTVALTPEPLQPGNPDTAPNYTVPASGTLTFTRYFAVGDGTVASIVDVRNELHALDTGTVTGRVTEAGSGRPVAGAEIAMISSGRDGFPPEHGPTTNVVNHFRTDARGEFHGTYPAGTYTLHVNVPGRLAPTPATRDVTIVNDQTTASQDFTVPAPTTLRVLVKDQAGRPVAAKVQLVGTPLGPDGNEPRNADCFGNPSAGCQNPLNIGTGFFGDPKADPLPPGIALAEFAVRDDGSGAVTLGDTGAMEIEPGTYTLAVSHGPRYSAPQGPLTLTQGEHRTVQVTVTEVMPTPGFIYGDFHVHSFDSPDSEVTNRERVATYLSEDMDFFTPSDHDMRVDFAPVVAAMGVGSRIATAPSAEVTTFDYGHFNFWPVAIETDAPCADEDFAILFGIPCGAANNGQSTGAKISFGATDWGGPAPLGQDFPSAGHFSRAPAEIFAAAAGDPLTPGQTVVHQINHIDSHFGDVSGSGLGIDTAQDPPQSTIAPASRRLTGTNLFSNNFHTLELLIGTDGVDYQDNLFYNQNAGDWFNLLNQGKFHTGISNSDTHQRRVTSLHTRNQISVPATLLTADGRADFADLSANPHAVGNSVRSGFTTMTTAPFLAVSAAKGGLTASRTAASTLGGTSNPLPAADGTVTLQVDVKSPLWAPYDQILVFVNGETVRHVDEFGQPSTSTPRYRICGPAQTVALVDADRPQVEAIPGNTQSKRFQTSKSLTVAHPGGDYWIVVMVRGTKGVSPTMWPVVPNSHVAAADDADADGVRALAVSNPIYVNVDGGAWVPPGVANTAHSGALLPPDGCPSDLPPA